MKSSSNDKEFQEKCMSLRVSNCSDFIHSIRLIRKIMLNSTEYFMKSLSMIKNKNSHTRLPMSFPKKYF